MRMHKHQRHQQQQQQTCARREGGATRASMIPLSSSSLMPLLCPRNHRHHALSLPLLCSNVSPPPPRGCGVTSTSYNSSRSHLSVVARATKKEQQRRPSIPLSPPPNKNNNDENDDDLYLESKKGGLLLLRWSLYATQRWDVPWSGKQTAITMFAWLASFVAVGASLAPLAAAALGAPYLGALSAQDKSLFLLVNQIVETAAGLGIVRATASKYPASELPRDLLRVDFRRPFSFDQGAAVDNKIDDASPSRAKEDPDFDDDDDKGRAGGGWLSWALVGIAASPLVIGAAATAAAALSDLSGGATSGGRGTADAVAGLLDASGGVDVTTLASLLAVTAVFAPILEETVFRGFLLPSLTKVMPVPAAVVVSAAGFATAHLSARDFPQLFAFGILLGFVYVRSRNLLSTMVIHGVWNGGVLLLLAALASAGVDLGKLLAS